jgi:hypothetical protein
MAIATSNTKPNKQLPYSDPNNPNNLLPLVAQPAPNTGGMYGDKPLVAQRPPTQETGLINGDQPLVAQRPPQTNTGGMEGTQPLVAQKPPVEQTGGMYGDKPLIAQRPPTQQDSGGTGTNTADLSEQVLNQAQRTAMQGYKSQLSPLIQQQTANFLRDPNQGIPENYVQQQLEAFNRDRAQAYETARQGMAPVAGSAEQQREMIRTAMTNVEDSSRLGADLEQQQAQMKRDNLIAALAEGRATESQVQDAFNQNLQNLLKTRETGEAGLQREWQTGERLGTQEYQTGVLKTQQEFTAKQADLDRAHQEALAKGDNETALKIEQMQTDLQKEMQSKEYIWKTQERVAAQDWEGAQNEMNRGLEEAIKKGDWSNALEIEKMRTESASKLQTNQQAWLTTERLSTQDFEEQQADLERQQADEIAKGNWENAFKIEELKGTLADKQQKAEMAWKTGERIATESWQTGERISQQDYETGMSVLEQQNKLALQYNDIQAQKNIADQQNKLQLAMQTANFSQQEKMAYLDYELEDARANLDYQREVSILEFRHGQEMETIRQQQGHEASMQYNQQQFEQAMQKGDYAQAQTMLRLQQQFQADEALKDRALEEARIKLQQQGVDMARVEQQYNMLAEQDPTAAFNYLQHEMKPYGVKLVAKDAATVAKQAIQADFEAQQYQWGLMHPGDMNEVGGLTQAGMKNFLDQYNQAISGERSATYDNLIKGLANVADLRGGADPNSPNNQAYNDILSKSPQWSPQFEMTGGAILSDKGVGAYGIIKNPPAVNSVIKYDGKLYQVVSGVNLNTEGSKYEYFTVIDVNTGETKKIAAPSQSTAGGVMNTVGGVLWNSVSSGGFNWPWE